MLANVLFRDIFAHLDVGILPVLTGFATGTVSGSAVQLGGTAPFGKMVARFIVTSGSAAASLSAYLATATASNGTFTSVSQTLVSAKVSLASQYWLVLDTRMEAFANLNTNAQWIKVVYSLTGAPLPGALDVLGWESGNDPASNFDASVGVAAVIVAETDFY